MRIETGQIGDYALRLIENLSSFSLPISRTPEQRAIKALHDARVITDNDIEEALAKYAKRTGMTAYNKIMGCGDYPDHVGAEFLAYVLTREGVLTEEQKGEIRLDHGETIETFVKIYERPSLLSELREQLLNPPEDDIEHPVCLEH